MSVFERAQGQRVADVTVLFLEQSQQKEKKCPLVGTKSSFGTNLWTETVGWMNIKLSTSTGFCLSLVSRASCPIRARSETSTLIQTILPKPTCNQCVGTILQCFLVASKYFLKRRVMLPSTSWIQLLIIAALLCEGLTASATSYSKSAHKV